MKRLFDLFLAILLLMLLIIPVFILWLAVKLSSKGPGLYWSDRVGRNNILFKMPKFRTMQLDAPVVATHLLHDPEAHLTIIGSFLRRSSMDEMPPLWSILLCDMCFWGAGPALFRQ